MDSNATIILLAAVVFNNVYFFIISSHAIKGIGNSSISARFYAKNDTIKKWSNKPRAGLFDQGHQVINDAKIFISSIYTYFIYGYSYAWHKIFIQNFKRCLY